jgi:hypothetical protein
MNLFLPLLINVAFTQTMSYYIVAVWLQINEKGGKIDIEIVVLVSATVI